MRKFAITLAAAAAVLLAGAFTYSADATLGSGTLGLPMAAKDYSPVDRVSCRTAGPLCPLGYTRVCRPFKCWCARCK